MTLECVHYFLTLFCFIQEISLAYISVIFFADSESVSRMAPTRVAVVEEMLAEPKDIEVYKAIYENVILIGSGTYGSVYYIRQVSPYEKAI